MRKMKGGIIATVLLVSLVTITLVSAADHVYPGDSIQDAIDTASPGGTIYIHAGTYTERFFIGKNITLIGDGMVVIDGGGSGGSVVVNFGTQVVISGLIITNGVAFYGGGIYNESGTLTLTNCTVSGNTASRNATHSGGIYNGGTLIMRNCTVSNNTADATGGTSLYARGGGIYNEGTLTMTNCVIRGNTAVASDSDSHWSYVYGGGIYNDGILTITNCAVSGNNATANESDQECYAYGGGIYNNDDLILTNCTVSGNTASASALASDSRGGGIYNSEDSTATISSNTISGNNADWGGGVANAGTLTVIDSTIGEGNNVEFAGGGIGNWRNATLINCTISGNSGTGVTGGAGIENSDTMALMNCTISGNETNVDGGGIRNTGSMTLTNCTITNNTADADGNGGIGGGICNYGPAIEIRNTIIAGNINNYTPVTSDATGFYTSHGYNLIGNTSGITGYVNPGTDITGIGPHLGMLAHNGGPTMTHALLAGSPAINSGSCTDINDNPVLTDQRGISRPQGFACDIGAYEYIPFVNPVAAFIPVKNYHLAQVNAYLTCIEDNLPEDIPGDIQDLLDELQERIDNANTTGNTIHANNELLRALELCETIKETLGITCS